MQCSPRGEAVLKIQSYLDNFAHKENGFLLWGIGDHGGGPSREDLLAIADVGTYVPSHPKALCHGAFSLSRTSPTELFCVIIELIDSLTWVMDRSAFTDKIGEFKLISDAEANAYNGYPDESYHNVRVIENGAVRTVIQATIRYSNSYAVVTYSVSKQNNYVNIHIKTFINDVSTMYKLCFDAAEGGNFLGQTAFGTQQLENDGTEGEANANVTVNGVTDNIKFGAFEVKTYIVDKEFTQTNMI